jgi:hypothetical protein
MPGNIATDENTDGHRLIQEHGALEFRYFDFSSSVSIRIFICGNISFPDVDMAAQNVKLEAFTGANRPWPSNTRPPRR